jgi:alkanesulfonate monooxygenase
MSIALHWFLPNGDSRVDLSLGNAVGAQGSRVLQGSGERAPDIGYIGQIARAAEQLGFAAALTPTSSWCEDAWVMAAALTHAAQMAATRPRRWSTGITPSPTRSPPWSARAPA